MSKREKEEERIERIIRGLLKLPENRRCINCNSLGPQYVCTTFLTFVCTNCSGVHREFTHRVKSVSMAKFTAEEVSALQAGGNERARQLYFKEWDPQLNSYPDGSNLHRLRDFIKHVYVDRKYTGERSNERLPRLRLGDIEDSYESRRVGAYRVGSRSPSYDDRYEYNERSVRGGRNEDRSFRYYYDERRSPRYSRENSRSGGFKKSPVRFEVVDDRIRDEGTRSSRLPDSRKFAESGIRSKSPHPEKSMDRSRSPAVRPAKDVLGDKALPLPLGDHSEAAERDTKDSGKNQSGTSSGSSATNDKNPLEHKSQNPESLIDFDSDSKSADATATPQAQQNHLPGNGGNHSSESSMKSNAPPAPKPNTLEFLLLELSGPPVVPASSVSETSANVNSPTASVPTPDGFSVAGPPGQMLGLPSGASASTNASAGIVRMGSVAAAAPLGRIPTLPTSCRASTTASRSNVPSGSVASAAPGGQMSTLPNTANAFMGEYGGNMFVGGVSQAAPASQISTSSSVGASAAPSGGSVPNADVSPGAFMEQTLTLLDASASPSTTNLHEQPPNGDSQSAPDMNDGSTFKVPNEQLASSLQQHQPSAYPAMHDPSNGRKLINASVGAPNNWMPTSSNVHETQGLSITSNEKISENASKPTQGSNSGVKSQPLLLETKTGGRRELPADIFAASLSPASGPFQGWQTGQSYGMGYNRQYYPNAVPGLAYTNPANSMNPFDVNNETSLVQAQPFPSFGNMRAALPNVPPTGALLRTFSIDSNSSGFMAPPSPLYPSAMASPSSPPSSAMFTGSHTGQQVHMAMPHSRPQGAGGVGVGIDEALFGLSNVGQESPSGSSPSATPISFPPKGGNPFG